MEICMKEATRYIALLRGVNISGKYKVPMAELKKAFEELGFGAVKTLSLIHICSAGKRIYPCIDNGKGRKKLPDYFE